LNSQLDGELIDFLEETGIMDVLRETADYEKADKEAKYNALVYFLENCGYKLGITESRYSYELTLTETKKPAKTTEKKANEWATKYFDGAGFEFIRLKK
jgi:hypothetical protein